jgi:hypothetical protein
LPPAAQLEEMYTEAMQDVFPQCLACKEKNKQIDGLIKPLKLPAPAPNY